MKKSSKAIADQFREVYLSGTWIANTNLRSEIQNTTWEVATKQVGSLNTIAALAFHLNYYVDGIIKVYESGVLDIKDKYSFDMQHINSAEDWDELKSKFWSNAERLAELIEELSDDKIFAPFLQEKYGSNYRNLTGMIEHAYYHLGQVVLIKKILKEQP